MLTAPQSRRECRVLGVLGASIGLLLITSARAERAARQQLEFVASVPRVQGDAGVLQSALQNAVGNAVNYGTKGSTVEIDLAATPRTVRVTVADRGIGIDASDLPQVFEPFFRGRRAVESRVRGSGIGLSVVQRIVEAHGGEVGLAARDGGGVVLTVELPALPDAEATA